MPPRPLESAAKPTWSHADLVEVVRSQGGAVVADPSIIELLTSAARTFIFDTALAPACAAAALEALHIIEATLNPLVSDVRSHASALQWAAEQIGWQSTTPNGAVISLLVGEPQAAVVAADACARRGVWVGCFRPPSVPDGGFAFGSPRGLTWGRRSRANRPGTCTGRR